MEEISMSLSSALNSVILNSDQVPDHSGQVPDHSDCNGDQYSDQDCEPIVEFANKIRKSLLTYPAITANRGKVEASIVPLVAGSVGHITLSWDNSQEVSIKIPFFVGVGCWNPECYIRGSKMGEDYDIEYTSEWVCFVDDIASYADSVARKLNEIADEPVTQTKLFFKEHWRAKIISNRNQVIEKRLESLINEVKELRNKIDDIEYKHNEHLEMHLIRHCEKERLRSENKVSFSKIAYSIMIGSVIGLGVAWVCPFR